MSIVYEIKDKNDLSEVMSSNYNIIIIDIYADWCQPCKYLAPKMEQWAAKYSSPNVLFCKLNSETNLKNIKGLPTVEFWVNGTLHHTVLGADVKKIESTLEKLIPTPNPSQTLPSPNINEKFNYKYKSVTDTKYKTFGKYFG